MIQWKEKNALIDTRCTRKAVTTTAGMENPRLFQLCTCASISLSHTHRGTRTCTYTCVSALHISSSSPSTSFCALWHLFKRITLQADKPCTSPVHSVVNIHMYFPWVHTPSSHFHMCKGALKQSTSTTTTTRTVSWHFSSSPAPWQHWQRAPYSFCSDLLAKGREGRRMKALFPCPPCGKDMPKQARCP